MKIKCEYCGNYIQDTDPTCPNCNGVNAHLVRNSIEAPHTIEELKMWYKDHNLPHENITRFFIGKDIREPRAFGIYYDSFSGNYIVYKNKNSGERAIRYEGKDEAYAVNELYMKLKEEIVNQKERNRSNHSSGDADPFSKLFFIHFILVFICFPVAMFDIPAYLFLFLSLNPGIFIMLPILSAIKNKKIASKIEKSWHIISFIIFGILLLLPGIIGLQSHKTDGYYKHNDSYYYSYGNSWYFYDYDGWNSYGGSTSGFEYVGDTYDGKYDISSFEDTDYYSEPTFFDSYSETIDRWGFSDSGSSSSSSDWDSSSSWDSSDSWDSGGTDFDSDW